MNTNQKLLQSVLRTTVFFTICLMPALALAAPTGGGAGLPWESSFKTIQTSIQVLGGVLLTIGVIMAGIKMATGEGGGMGRQVVGLVVGGGLVLGASTVIDTVFSGASGLPL